MALQPRNRLHFGRKSSPTSRNTSAAARVEVQQKRRKLRAKKWRERFRKFALSTWQSNTIVQSIRSMFLFSAESARAVREATGTQIVGTYYGRQLRVEGLEERQMLSTTPWNLATQGNFSQNWTNTALITVDHDWSAVPSIVGYSGAGLTGSTGVNPGTLVAPNTTANVIANQNNPNTLATGGVAEFGSTTFLDENFDGYANQAAFLAAWPAIGTTTDTTKQSASLSTAQASSAPNSVFVPVSTTAVTASTEFRNRRSFSETGVLAVGDQIVWSYDFYDSPANTAGVITGNPQRNFSNLQDSTAPGSSNQLVSMGLNNNQLASDSGGNYYMARILGYTVVNTADPDGGPNESGTLGAGAYFKLNDFGTGLRTNGWHNLKVIITTPDGVLSNYQFFVDGVLAEKVSGVAGTLRSYDNITIGSGLTNGGVTANFDNQKLQYISAANPVVALQGSGSANAPNLVLYANSTGQQKVTVSYNLRDIDGSADNSIQQVALQYRIGGTGNFINVPTAAVADASTGPSQATSVTPVTVTLPAWTDVADLQFRIITADAAGADEWIGVDDITITSIPIQPPVFTSSATPSVPENTASVVALASTDPDVPAQPATYSITGGADQVKFSITGGNQLVFLTSPDFENPTDADTNNTYLVQVTANDGNGGVTVQNLTVSVTPVNEFVPVANGDANDVTEDSVLSATGNLLTNDTDADLPAETLTVAAPFIGTSLPGTYGSLDLAADGTYTYHLNNSAAQLLAAGQLVSDSFNYRTTDGTNLSSLAALTITVHGVNDVPSLGGDAVADVTEDTTVLDGGLLTISDADASQSSFQLGGGATAYGSYTLDAAGNWTYTLNNSLAVVQALTTGQTLSDSFTAVSSDGTASQVVNVTIHGLVEPPLVVNGDGNSNSLVIDLNAGTYTLDGGVPQSLYDTPSIAFNGGAGFDSLTITGGVFGTTTYNYLNATDGSIDLGPGFPTLQYTGLDPIANSGSVSNAVFNLTATGDNATLHSSATPGMVELLSNNASFETTNFSTPSTSLAVNALGGDDTLTVVPSNGYSVSVDGGGQSTADTLNVDAAGAYAINTGSEIRVQGFANIAYTAFETINLMNAAAAPTTLYVDDSWLGTLADADPDGLGAAIRFGVDAFASIQDAINAAVDGFTTTIYVHSGVYNEALTISKNLTISDILNEAGSVAVNAGFAFNGVDVVPTSAAALNVAISGLDFTASSNGIHVGKLAANAAQLALTNSTITGGLNGIWVDGGTLNMIGSVISGVSVFGVQVSNGGDADITNSEITGTATTAAGVTVTSGHADILGTVLKNDNRGLLVSGTGTATVHGSSLDSNSIAGVVNGTAAVVDASANWWGTNVASGVQAKTVGPVDFTPFLDANESLANQSVLGFQADFSHLHVTTLGSQTGGGRIVDAIDYLADGALVGANRVVEVHAGTYTEDVNAYKSARLLGENHNTTTIRGAIGGIGSTVQVTASNVEIAGFTITRDGNSVAMWNNAGLNSAGISVQGTALTGMLVRDNIITGNRSGIDVNNSNGHTIRNNQIVDNRTGMILRNQTDNLSVVENDISNNWTVGVLFLDASSGSNSPVQTALGSTFSNNNLSGNWYGQIVDRQIGGSLPAPGTTNIKDFSGNWFGTNAPVISTANSAEPGYAAQIPVAFGGSAVAPGGQPDILGPASANFDITPYLDLGTDTNVETTLGRGTFGFQGNFSTLHVTDALAQTGVPGRIQEGINTVVGGGTLLVHPGSYTGGADATAKSVTIAPGLIASGVSTGQVVLNGNLALDSDDTLQIQLNGTTTSLYDNIVVTGTVNLTGATLTASRSYTPFPGDEFILISNDGSDLVGGTFNGLIEGAIVYLGGIPYTISYAGGVGNNDVTLTVAQPTTVYANDTWLEQSDTSGGGAGIQIGDTVQSNTGAGDAGVSGLIYGYNAFSTIQNAINAVSIAGTVNVLAGEYAEQIDVNKSLTLLGAQSGTAGTAHVGAESIIRPSGSDADPNSPTGIVLVYVSADDVTIDGFTIDGRNPSIISGIQIDGQDIDATQGIVSYEGVGGITVANNIVQYTSYSGIEFYNYVDSSATSDNLIQGNLIRHLGDDPDTFAWGLGILIYNNFYADVVDNTIQDVRVGIQTGNFSQADPSSSADIDGNVISARGTGIFHNLQYNSASTFTISDNQISAVADPDRAYWDGILIASIQGTVDVVVEDNIINGSAALPGAITAGYDIWNTPSSATITLSGGTVNGVDYGVWANNWEGYFSDATVTDVEVSGVDINATEYGVYVLDSASNTNNAAVNVTINSNTDISTGSLGTGIFVSGSTATAIIDGNNSSIHGNLVGIDVNAGSATITGNHIYDNATGILFRGGGGGTVGGATALLGNNFDDGVAGDSADDNLTDIKVAADAGAVSILGNNKFAADTFFIENLSPSNFDISGLANTFDVSGSDANFRIEDKMHHKVDNDLTLASTGLVTWVASSVFVTDPLINPTSTDSSIQRGVDAAFAGYTVSVEAGTYIENVNVNKQLTLKGANSGNAGGGVRGAESIVQTNGNAVAVFSVSASGVTIDGFFVDGDDPLLAGLALESGDNTNASYGVRATTAVNNMIVENNIIKRVEIGVRGDGLGIGNLITRNWFDSVGHFDFGYAVSLRSNFYADITDNLMTRVFSGVHTNNFSLAGPATWTISGNEIHSYAAGLWHNLQYANATNLTVSNNQFLAEALAVANDVGILIVTQQNNISTTLTGNTVSSHDYGVVLYNTVSSNPITLGSSNTISNNGVGVYLTDIVGFNPVTTTILGGGANNPNGVSRAVLDGLSLSGNTTGILVNGTNVNVPNGAQLTLQNGVSVTGGAVGLSVVGPNAAIAGNTLANTSFSGQGNYYVSVTNGALDNQEVDATSASFGGTVGGSASLPVDFAIEDKLRHALDDTGVGLVRFRSNELFVTTPGTGLSDETIQNAVGAATSGNTIYVQAGTYVENVSIDKNLTLLSASGRGTTTIQGISGVGALGTVVLSGTTTDVNIGGDLVGPGDNGFTITGVDNGLPGIENGAIYILGTHSGTDILWNDVVANGDHGLVAEFGANLSNLTIDNNIFSGKTFVGANPAGTGFGAQFTLPNVPRQLVVIGNESIKSNITFTNNNLTGTTGGVSLTDNSGSPVAAHEQGNSLVTIDATGTLISGNTFNGTTADTAYSLRARGTNNIITDNDFVGASMGATTTDLLVNDAGNTIQGNQFSSSAGTAIEVAGGSATIGGLGLGEGNTITSYTRGIVVSSGSATVLANSATGGSYGLFASGGSVLAQGNTLTGNNVGIRVSGSAVVDAGSVNGTDGNPTGLGNSSGGNILTGYTGTAGNYAIENLNLDSAGNVNVYARSNSFGSVVPGVIELVVFHTVDDSQYTQVFFTPAVGPVVPGTVYVNDDWAGTGLGMDPDAGYANGNQFGTDAFASIQDAINAVGTNATIYVLNGTYNEAVVVNKAGTTLRHLDTIAEPLDPNSATEATVTRTSGTNSVVMEVTADGVTIDDFHIVINRPNSTVGIGASNTASTTFVGGSFDGLTITNNVITSAGSGGSVDTFLSTNASGIALIGNGTPIENVTIQGNTVDLLTSGSDFRRRAVYLREVQATVSGNDLKGAANDLIVQFAASQSGTGVTTIDNNMFRSGGVDLTENASTGEIHLTNNQFLITTPTSSQSLVIKHAVAAPILVQGNTFSGHALGISMGNSAGVTIDNNDFTPGAFASTADIVLDTGNFTGGAPAAPFSPVSATITNNEFFGLADANNHTGLAFFNENPGASVPDYGTVTIGGSGSENTFHSGLDTFIYLDPASIGGSAPVSANFDASQNKYQVTSGTPGTYLPTAMSLDQLFEVEDKVVHAVDVGTLGFVNILTGQVFVTTNSFFAPFTTSAKIQRGVNAASSGDTVHVSAGAFADNVNVNKFVKIIGAGSSATTVDQAVPGDIFALTASGASNANPLLLQGMKITPHGVGTQGINVSGTTSIQHIKLEDIYALGTSPSGPGIQEIGFRIMDSANVDDLVINNSRFEHLTHGMITEKQGDITGTTNVTNVLITNTHFDHNQSKGFYAEKLSNATFTNVVASDNGNAAFFVSGAGIEINLKGNLPTYTNLVFNNLTVNNNAQLSGSTGGGLLFKARGTGSDPSYAATPATLTNVQVNGGTFDGNRTGIRVGEPNRSNTSPTGVVLDGVTVTNSIEMGIDIQGGVSTVTHAHLSNNPTGIEVHNGKVTIIDNPSTISGGAVGIDVNGGVALVQTTNITGSTIGVQIRNNGIADLGQNGPGVNYTGLGVSTGGNNFTTYTAPATSTSGAIVNLNTGGTYSNAGPQGYAGAEKDVAAFNNLWNSPTATGIENVVWHDADSTAVGFVDYASLSNLLVSLSPLPTVATNQAVNESQVGGTATVYGQFTNDAQAHKVTITWGDGSPNTVVNLSAGVLTFAVAVPAGTYTDDPNGGVQTIHRAINVKVEEVANPGNFLNDGSLSVDVNNVIPTASLSTPNNTINEGQTLTLNIGAVVDPGADTVSAYRVNWGDGTNDVITGNLAAGDTLNHPYQDGLANPARTITLDIFDEDGTWNTVSSLSIFVNNVNPTAGNFFSFDSSVSEGSTTTVFFVGPFTDPGTPDGPFHFAYDFNGNGIYGEAGESGDGTYAGSGTSTSVIVPASFLADGPGSRTVNARIIDNDGGFTQYSVVIGITNVAPVVDAGLDTTVFPNTLLNHVVSFTDPGADSPWTVRINWDNIPGFDETFNVPAHSFNINAYSTWMYNNANIGNTYNVEVQVDDNDGGVSSDTFNVTVVEDTLRVTGFQANNSGFDVTFNRAPNLSDLNLYDSLFDGSPSVLEAADMTLVRNGSENIKGSMVWAPDTKTLSFVKTGGVLAQGNYTVNLLSSSIGFHDGLNLLDGDGDFNDNEVGDNYSTSFSVGVPAVDTRIVSLPDFSRGPGQAVGVPGTGTILPIKIDLATSVVAVDVDILFNPQLLNITAAALGAGPLAAGGWSITSNFISIDATHKLLKLTISGTTALSGTTVELIRLTSSVPATAQYESSQVLRLQNLRVNEDLIPSKADFAIHKVVYVGDADGDGAYGGTDAGLISAAVVHPEDTYGFDAHDWTDPRIVGDASGDGTLSGLDASDVAQEAILIDVPEVPPIPNVALAFNTTGVDPQYSIDSNIHAVRGGIVTVPVKLDVSAADLPPVVGATFNLYFDTNWLTYQSAANGSFWTSVDGWTITANPNVQPGRVVVSMYNSNGQASAVGVGEIAKLTFGVSPTAPVGTMSALDTGAQNPNEGHLVWTDVDGSVVVTNFPGDYNQNNVVDAPDYVLYRKTQGNSVPAFTGADGTGNGNVDSNDYDLWRANYGNVLIPGAGSGSAVAASQDAAAGDGTTVAPSQAVLATAQEEYSPRTAIEDVVVVAPAAAASGSVFQGSSTDTTGARPGRTTVAVVRRDEFNSRLIDANLIDLALAEPYRLDTNGDCSVDGEDSDHADVIDELFADLDGDVLAVRVS